MPKSHSRLFLLAIVSQLFLGSAAQAQGFKRFWHNMNAHYNGYFNAELRLKETVKQLEKQQQDNYEEVLPLFKIGDVTNGPKPSSAPLDEAVKKASNVIQLHPTSKWIDDCYMVIGQSYYYKRDLFESIETFQYVYTRYPNQPIKYDALCWIIRGFGATKQIAEARGAIDAANNLKFPAEKRPLLYKTIAAFYINQKEYIKASEQLQKLVAITKDKQDKQRSTFILAQIDQLAGNNDKAIAAFDRVLKMNPGYDMAFAARLNMARMFNANSAYGARIKRELKAMAKDDKNLANRDVLYYELGNIAVKENKVKEAVFDYKTSSATATKNLKQKALSQLALAELYYAGRQFTASQIYYDSAVTILPRELPQYVEASARKAYLTELIGHLQTIQLQDSLLRLAAMSDKDRLKAIINQIAADHRKQEEADREKEQQQLIAQQNAKAGANAQQINDPAAASTWYFYNPSAITAGAADFIRKWGTRPLEDDWRRSKKDPNTLAGGQQGNTSPPDGGQKSNPENGTGSNGQSKGNTNKPSDNSEEGRYLANVPLTPETKAQSEQKLMAAYFGLGQVYQEKVHNYAEAIAGYSKLIERFPGAPQKPAVYYNLYRCYEALNDSAKATYYKNLLLSAFPESPYAGMAQGKTQATASRALLEAANKDYELAYAALMNDSASIAWQLANRSDSLHKGSPLAPRFGLLKAMAAGKMNGKEAYIAQLEKVVKTYPNDPVKLTALEMLKVLRQTPDSTIAINKQEKPKVIYSFLNPLEKHYYVSVFDPEVKVVNDIKTRISDFNQRNFSLQSLQVQNLYMPDGTSQMINVQPFANLNKAYAYFTQLQVETPVFRGVSATQVVQFVISETNYKLMYQANDAKGYVKAFELEFQKTTQKK